MGFDSVKDYTSEEDELLTTGEAARLLDTSRQHIVDLCDRGDLPFVTTGRHRRVRRSDVEALRARTMRLTRDQRSSLWLGYAVAGKLVANPPVVLKRARSNLRRMQKLGSRQATNPWLSEWDRLLEGPVDDILNALTTRAPQSRELRQNSPFAGVLTEGERRKVLTAARRWDRKRSSGATSATG
jgi:excisionase family DNA binding protein